MEGDGSNAGGDEDEMEEQHDGAKHDMTSSPPPNVNGSISDEGDIIASAHQQCSSASSTTTPVHDDADKVGHGSLNVARQVDARGGEETSTSERICKGESPKAIGDGSGAGFLGSFALFHGWAKSSTVRDASWDGDNDTTNKRRDGGESSEVGTPTTDPYAAIESLPSRRVQTVSAHAKKYEPSKVAQERAKLKKVYSFVDVDTINLHMGKVATPSRSSTNPNPGSSEHAYPGVSSPGYHEGRETVALESGSPTSPPMQLADTTQVRDASASCDGVFSSSRGETVLDINNPEPSSLPSTPKDEQTVKGRQKRSLSLFASFRTPEASSPGGSKEKGGRKRVVSSPTWDESTPASHSDSMRVSGVKTQRRRSSILQIRNLKMLIASRENMKTSLASMRKRRQKLARGTINSNAKQSPADSTKTCEFIRENFGKLVVCTPVYENDDEEISNDGPQRDRKMLNAHRDPGSGDAGSSPGTDHMERMRRASSGSLMGATPPRPSLTEQSCGINDIIEGKNRNASAFNNSLSRMKAKIQIKTPTIINGLIHPECELKITWDLFVGVGVLYTLVIVPYQLSFLTTENDIGLLIFNVLCDVIFAIDICIKMNTAWRDRRGDLITDKKTVVAEYIFRGLFVVDVISCIPIDLMIYLAVSGDEDDEYRTLRYLKLLRLARLARLINCFKIANINLVLESFGKISMNPAMGRLFQFIIGFLSVTHVMACLWWAMGDRNNVSWWSGRAHSWAVDYADESSSYKYLVSLYWAMGTMSGVGYGDVIPQNSHERLFGIFAELVGVFAFGLVVGYVSTLVESVSYKNSVHRERHLKMSTYIKQRNLPGNLQKRLNEHVKWSVRNQVRKGEDVRNRGRRSFSREVRRESR